MVTGAVPPMRTSAPTERRTPGRPTGAWRSRSLRRPKRPHRPGFANRWTLRQGGWISGRGGCYTVQPRRQHRPPVWVYPAGLVPHRGPRVLGRGHPAPWAGDWSCRCRRKLLGRWTSTSCIPMVGAGAASGSTGWKIPAPARGFVHIRSYFLRLLRQLSFQLYELGLEFNHGMCDDAGCQGCARAGVAGPAVLALSMSSSRRSMRREISACAGTSSISKSLNALNTGSLNVTVVSS